MLHLLLMGSSNYTKERKMLAKYLSKHGRVTERGYKVSEWIDAAGVFALIFLAFGVVGSIESGKWF
jgi:hypothetical protein